LTAVAGCEDNETARNRIAQNNAVLRVPKREGIKKSPGVGIGKQQFPRLPAIPSYVKPGGRARANGKQVSRIGVKRLDITKIHRFGSRNQACAPMYPAVSRDKERSLRTASPNNLRGDNMQPAQTGFGV
jgi:hypothetical protein